MNFKVYDLHYDYFCHFICIILFVSQKRQMLQCRGETFRILELFSSKVLHAERSQFILNRM